MAPRTTRRSQPKAAEPEPEAPIDSKVLPLTSTNPPLLFILPQERSKDSRIVTLPNPASSVDNRYFLCPDNGLYEFTKISAPKKTPRSWLLAPEHTEEGLGEETNTGDSELAKGYTIEQPDLFIATPVDPLFFLLPALTAKNEDGNQKLFLSLEDHLDTLSVASPQLKYVLQCDTFKQSLESRANVVCDSVDVGDEKMYRLSLNRLARELLKKAENMAKSGLPASLEQEFVQEALRRPVPLIIRQESSMAMEDAVPTLDSQTSSFSTSAEDSQSTSMSGISTQTDATSVSGSTLAGVSSYGAPNTIVHLLRLRVALNFIMSAYVSPSLRTQLQANFDAEASTVSFVALDEHLKQIETLRKETQALRSVSDNISRKRSNMNDEEAEAAREEKKRMKMAEEEAKKNQSRGVKQLAKVNTTGMKKLSSFFAKAPPKKSKS
ncbi:hypothetical protein MBLNU457_5211t1 [Dothideomycetes sp. NU457]